MKTPAIVVERLSKSLGGKQVLQETDFSLLPGRVTVLLGRNGAGKTTLLRCLVGLLAPDTGKVRVLDRDPIKARRQVRERIGYVPDAPDAEPWMNLRELFDLLRPSFPQWDDAEAIRLTEVMEVPMRTPFRHLSRGEAMKGMIAAALAPRPELVIMDEPFAGLDPVAARDVLRAIVGEVGGSGRTVFCSTHDLDVAARIADDILVLANGRVAKHAPIDDLSPKNGAPQSLETALVGAISTSTAVSEDLP